MALTPEITVELPKHRLDALLRDLRTIPRDAPRALNAAINKTAKTGQSMTVKAIAGEVNVKQKDIRLKGGRKGGRYGGVALERSSVQTLSAAVRVTGKRMPLKRFGAKQGKRGVTYKIEKGGKRRKAYGRGMPPAFLESSKGRPILMPSGYHGVFRRLGGARLPIVQLFGPSLPQVALESETLDRKLRFELSETMEKNLTNQTERLLARAARRR